jgi:hypothetical protein
MEKKEDEKKVGYYLLILLIIIIMFLLLTKGRFQFTYDLYSGYLDGLLKNVIPWDLDFKYFFRSTNNENAFLEKGFSDTDKLFNDSFNV